MIRRCHQTCKKRKNNDAKILSESPDNGSNAALQTFLHDSIIAASSSESHSVMTALDLRIVTSLVQIKLPQIEALRKIFINA